MRHPASALILAGLTLCSTTSAMAGAPLWLQSLNVRARAAVMSEAKQSAMNSLVKPGESVSPMVRFLGMTFGGPEVRLSLVDANRNAYPAKVFRAEVRHGEKTYEQHLMRKPFDAYREAGLWRILPVAHDTSGDSFRNRWPLSKGRAWTPLKAHR